MPHIPLKEELPGVTGLLDYRKDTTLPIWQLIHILLRGESTLTEGERKLIASVVSHGNECNFCNAIHSTTADILLEDHNTTDKIKKDLESAPINEIATSP